MIQAIASLGAKQFQRVKYWANDRKHFAENINNYKVIGVEIVSDRALAYNPVYQNVVTTNGSIVLQTKYKADYQPRQIVQYRGDMYEIVNVTQIALHETPQNLGIVKQVNWAYAIELLGVTVDAPV